MEFGALRLMRNKSFETFEEAVTGQESI